MQVSVEIRASCLLFVLMKTRFEPEIIELGRGSRKWRPVRGGIDSYFRLKSR